MYHRRSRWMSGFLIRYYFFSQDTSKITGVENWGQISHFYRRVKFRGGWAKCLWILRVNSRNKTSGILLAGPGSAIKESLGVKRTEAKHNPCRLSSNDPIIWVKNHVLTSHLYNNVMMASSRLSLCSISRMLIVHCAVRCSVAGKSYLAAVACLARIWHVVSPMQTKVKSIIPYRP